jgi:hypothetical protein
MGLDQVAINQQIFNIHFAPKQISTKLFQFLFKTGLQGLILPKIKEQMENICSFNQLSSLLPFLLYLSLTSNPTSLIWQIYHSIT